MTAMQEASGVRVLGPDLQSEAQAVRFTASEDGLPRRGQRGSGAREV